MKKVFAETSWNVSDILSMYNATEKQAEAFLKKYEYKIVENMVAEGWNCIACFAEEEGLTSREE